MPFHLSLCNLSSKLRYSVHKLASCRCSRRILEANNIVNSSQLAQLTHLSTLSPILPSRLCSSVFFRSSRSVNLNGRPGRPGSKTWRIFLFGCRGRWCVVQLLRLSLGHITIHWKNSNKLKLISYVCTNVERHSNSITRKCPYDKMSMSNRTNPGPYNELLD